MMTELKWPGWPELPLLLLFVPFLVLFSFLLLAGADEEEKRGHPSLEADPADSPFREDRLVAPIRYMFVRFSIAASPFDGITQGPPP